MHGKPEERERESRKNRVDTLIFRMFDLYIVSVIIIISFNNGFFSFQ